MIHPFSNKVSRKNVVEEFLVFKRVMILRIGHPFASENVGTGRSGLLPGGIVVAVFDPVNGIVAGKPQIGLVNLL